MITVIIEVLNVLVPYATVFGVGVAAYQIKRSNIQQRVLFEDSINKEYRDIIQRIPYKALIGEEVPSTEASAVHNEIYNYMDLCNEQIYLRMSNRVSKKTWNNWQEGIKTNFELKAFNDTLAEVFEKLPSNFSELQKVKALGFSTDPKLWKTTTT
ncbi:MULTISPECIES: hypothetical protein [unclassified Psychrobacter]|uniref:hypothetical protein n=1 Tax=unclassified Psychrobacter TaxID=196806 RepID=UPI003FB667C7